MDERARNKRKLQEMQDQEEGWEDDSGDEDGYRAEKPGEGLRWKGEDEESSPKKPKITGVNAVESREEKAKRKVKLQKKRVKKEEKKEVKKQVKAEKAEKAAAAQKAQVAKKTAAKGAQQEIQPSTEPNEAAAPNHSSDMEPIDVSGLVSKDEDEASHESSPASEPASAVFDGQSPRKNESAEPASTETSVSSAIPPSEKPKYIKMPSDMAAVRVRLAAAIAARRAARNADGPDGKPIQTREELLESRREKQAQRKVHKQQMRRLAKEEEDRKRDEALASARTSPGSMLSPMIDMDDDRSANHFAFGRIAFADGTQMSHDLSYEKGAQGKKKGNTDAKSALVKLEAQKKRIAGMDEEKRKDVLEKEAWLAARRRTEGEKIRDNETLLKKAIKRKDKVKRRSDREWKDRAEGVANAIKDRQKKREDNLRKRREDKMSKGKKKKGGASKKKTNRPGFEGGFGGSGGKRK